MRVLIRLAGCMALILSASAGAASVSPAELAQCAGIASAEPRLACYDTLAHRVAGAGASAAPAASPSVQAPAPVAKTTPAVPPAAAPTPVPTALDDPKNFGLSLNQMQRGQSDAPKGPKSISARINSVSPGTTGRSRIVLDNDQVWDVLDDDGALAAGNPISIRKASLGSFLMSAPSHHLYRVHRVN